MPPSLSIALQITVIGMSLVFGAIVLLWGLMALLVRLAADRPAPAAAPVGSDRRRELKQRAAAAAVAAALAVQAQKRAEETAFQPREFPLPPTAIVSAWQAVRRAQLLNQRGPVR
ncbi:MAG: OadG family protein [Anaerolineales bacterium]|nr:OadG family protein [Anaerolineales bacterium]